MVAAISPANNGLLYVYFQDGSIKLITKEKAKNVFKIWEEMGNFIKVNKIAA